MTKDQAIGTLLLIASIAVIIFYMWGVFLAEEWISTLLIKLTAAVAVGGVFGILAWIGYTLATTPPPKPIEEIEKELEQETKEEKKEEQKETQQ